MIICEAVFQAHKHHPGQSYLVLVCNRISSLFSAVPVTELPIIIPHTELLAQYAAQYCQVVLVIKMEDFLSHI